MNIPFTKMHGLGNDFVILDTVRHPIEITTDLIKKMADRHFGIGFDQLLVVAPPQQTNVDFEYRIFNADGSEVGQCGNGARCVGRFLVEVGLVSQQKPILLSTRERVLEVHTQIDDQVSVNMGIPLFEPEEIPFQALSRERIYTIEIDNVPAAIGVVNIGNSHTVLLVNDINTAAVDVVGSKLVYHPRFPEGVNVGFMQCVDRSHILLRVYERGAGETLACGSGACAAMIIGYIQGLLDHDVEVKLTGGVLRISWQGEGYPVWMTGPAIIVFKGEWLLGAK